MNFKENQSVQIRVVSIQAKLKQSEFELTNGDYVIVEVCRDLKTDVQLAKERKIRELESKTWLKE